LVVEGKYYTTPLGLGMGRQFLGLEVDLSARYVVLAATLTSRSVIYLLEGRKKWYAGCPLVVLQLQGAVRDGGIGPSPRDAARW
jgi:hypothetical protein